MYNLVVKFTETENVITINQMDESPMRFLSSHVRFTQGFFFLAVPKWTVNNSFSVGIMLHPLTILSNRYMLDSYSNKQKDRWGGLKTPHHLESQMNTKCSVKWGISLRFLRSLVLKTSEE